MWPALFCFSPPPDRRFSVPHLQPAVVTNPRACTTWDDPERLPENRRSGTGKLRPRSTETTSVACCATVATAMAASQPTDKGVTASRAGVAGPGRPLLDGDASLPPHDQWGW